MSDEFAVQNINSRRSDLQPYSKQKFKNKVSADAYNGVGRGKITIFFIKPIGVGYIISSGLWLMLILDIVIYIFVQWSVGHHIQGG